MNNPDSYVIGFAGGSGSGKTTVINKILEKIGKEKVIILQHDWYYKDNRSVRLLKITVTIR